MHDLIVWKRIYRQVIISWSTGKEEYSQDKSTNLFFHKERFSDNAGICKYICEIDISNFVITRSWITLVAECRTPTLCKQHKVLSQEEWYEWNWSSPYESAYFFVLNCLVVNLFTYFDSWKITRSSSCKRIDEK